MHVILLKLQVCIIRSPYSIFILTKARWGTETHFSMSLLGYSQRWKQNIKNKAWLIFKIKVSKQFARWAQIVMLVITQWNYSFTFVECFLSEIGNFFLNCYPFNLYQIDNILHNQLKHTYADLPWYSRSLW